MLAWCPNKGCLRRGIVASLPRAPLLWLAGKLPCFCFPSQADKLAGPWGHR